MWCACGERRGIYKSEDYGESYRFLTSRVTYLIESRSSDGILFGVSPGDKRLLISRDGGAAWKPLENSASLFSPIYLDRETRELRTWWQKRSDMERAAGHAIEQLETDPNDARILYVVTFKGLFRSADSGNTFTLLPLAKDKVEGVDGIAVDPEDGRFLYAAVGLSEVYRSGDYGCTWERVELFR
jgi:photosystem II stability/assembly factor-like uncharacterized protein